MDLIGLEALEFILFMVLGDTSDLLEHMVGLLDTDSTLSIIQYLPILSGYFGLTLDEQSYSSAYNYSDLTLADYNSTSVSSYSSIGFDLPQYNNTNSTSLPFDLNSFDHHTAFVFQLERLFM